MMVRYAAVDGIRAFDFGDECIIFNPLSWDAHLLNAAAASVLELLMSAPHSAEEIEARLREWLVDSEREAAALHARHLLDELGQLGLLRVLDSDAAADR